MSKKDKLLDRLLKKPKDFTLNKFSQTASGRNIKTIRVRSGYRKLRKDGLL